MRVARFGARSGSTDSHYSAVSCGSTGIVHASSSFKPRTGRSTVNRFSTEWPGRRRAPSATSCESSFRPRPFRHPRILSKITRYPRLLSPATLQRRQMSTWTTPARSSLSTSRACSKEMGSCPILLRLALLHPFPTMIMKTRKTSSVHLKRRHHPSSRRLSIRQVLLKRPPCPPTSPHPPHPSIVLLRVHRKVTSCPPHSPSAVARHH